MSTQQRLIETIVAIATPPGRGGVGIVRVSGPRVDPIANHILGKIPKPRRATHANFRNAENQLIDQGIAIYFPGPHSFTGEDVLELQGHGGPVVMDMLVNRAVELGARLAKPGEFSERAFLNDKLDLVQAEAIADLIDAASNEAARAAMRSLQGEFSNQINTLVDELIELRMYIESAIDFPEEEIDFLSEGNISGRVRAILHRLRGILDNAQQGRILREGINIVIAGKPNAGKSSLLNRFAARESAIVTNIPGTTRDVLREQILIDGLPVHVVDTAGLRDTDDIVEQHGVTKAWHEIRQADRVLLVVDDQADVDEQVGDIVIQLPADLPLTIVRNKIDRSGRAVGEQDGPFGPEVALSARTGAGMDVLANHLKACVGFSPAGEGTFMARRRHLGALQRACELVENGLFQLESTRAGELLAEDLRQAQLSLSEITGAFTSDDLLGRIFSSFCVGK